MKSVSGILVFVVLFISDTDAASWSYICSEEWPDTCQSGKRQSPIELWKKSATKTSMPDLHFKHYEDIFRASLENNGHTVEIQLISKNNTDLPLLSGDHLGEYILHNIHFHWDSEHTVNGKRYPLEGHYVHYKQEYGNLTNAISQEDGIVVIGVLFKETPKENEKLRNIFDPLKTISKIVNVPNEIKNGFSVADILPKNTKNFYTYDGSLTTPNCNEAVKWIIFEELLSIGKNQLKNLRGIQTHTGELLRSNFRPLQKLNARKVLYSA